MAIRPVPRLSVMALYGVPACGAGFDRAHDAARDRGLRIIAPDRPGVGQSHRRAGHRIADYPAHLASLADALGIDRFVVWGYSGRTVRGRLRGSVE